MLYSQKACWNVAIKCFYKKLWTVWWLRSEGKEMMQKVRTLENVVLLKFCQRGLLLQGLRSCDEYFRNWWQQKLRQGVCECDFDRIPYQWSSNLEWPQSYWVSILMSYIKDITVLKATMNIHPQLHLQRRIHTAEFAVNLNDHRKCDNSREPWVRLRDWFQVSCYRKQTITERWMATRDEKTKCIELWAWWLF